MLFALPGVGWGGNNLHQPFLAALQKALTFNPEILAAQDQLAIQQEKLGLAQVELLPDLSLNLSAKYNQDEWKGGKSSRTPATLSVSLSQPLIDFNQWRSIDNAHLPIKKAEMDLLISTENLFFKVVEETVAILQAKEVLQRSQSNLALTQEHLRATRLRFDAGELTQTDISQAESRVASIQAELISTHNQIKMSMARFEEITGIPAPANLSIPSVLPAVLHHLEQSPIHQVALRPDVASALIQLEESRRNIDIQRGGMLPVLTLTSDASRTWHSDSSSRPGANSALNVSLGLTMPIDARGKYSRKGRQAMWERDEKLAKLDQVRQQAIREVKHALLGLSSARARDKALKQVEQAAKMALSGVEKEFTVGTRSSPDLLSAQNELFEAQRDLTKSHYDLILEQYKLLKAKGQLTLSKPVFDLNPQPQAPNNQPAMAQHNPANTQYGRVLNQALNQNWSGHPPHANLQNHPTPTSSTRPGLSNKAALPPSASNPLPPMPNKIEEMDSFSQAIQPETVQPLPQPQAQGGGGSLYAQSNIQAIPAHHPGLIIRVASFPKPAEAIAEQLARHLVSDQFSVIKTAEMIQGSPYIHILSGPFAHQDEAERVKQILQQVYHAQPLIENWNPQAAALHPTPPPMVQTASTVQPVAHNIYSASQQPLPEPSLQEGMMMQPKEQPQEQPFDPSFLTAPLSSNQPLAKELTKDKPIPEPVVVAKERVIVTESGIKIGVGRVRKR